MERCTKLECCSLGFEHVMSKGADENGTTIRDKEFKKVMKGKFHWRIDEGGSELCSE